MWGRGRCGAQHLLGRIHLVPRSPRGDPGPQHWPIGVRVGAEGVGERLAWEGVHLELGKSDCVPALWGL